MKASGFRIYNKVRAQKLGKTDLNTKDYIKKEKSKNK